jgi:hypothetical protein
VSFVEVDAPGERRHRHAGEMPQREPPGVAWDARRRETGQVREREPSFLSERIAQGRSESRSEDEADTRDQLGSGTNHLRGALG